MEPEKKKVVLVSGASGGIGSATCHLFAVKGWNVVGVDKEVAKETSPAHAFFTGDFSDPEFNRDVFDRVQKDFGSLDSIVNNAAVQICRNLLETTIEQWDWVMKVNVRTILLSTQNGFEMLRQGPGSLVNVSSVHALATSVGLGAYATSKGAVVSLTRALALELAPHSIRVNAILPGAVETRMLLDGLQRDRVVGQYEPALLGILGKKHPLGRIGQPKEIAETILFLANGEQSSYMTGQSIVVDGGAIAHLSTE